MDFLQITFGFENGLTDDFDCELLESHYLPYSFGSGIAVYGVKGFNVKLAFEGKDGLVEVSVSAKHAKYPTDKWSVIFEGSASEFFSGGIEAVKKKVSPKPL